MAKEAHVVNRYQLKLDLFTLFILLYRDFIKELLLLCWLELVGLLN